MTDRLLRGRVLSFVSEPQGPDDLDACQYFEDGAVLVRDGLISALGDYSDIIRGLDAANQQGGPNAIEITDHRPHLIMPGFIDAHIHFPQVQVVGSWGTKLLDWLNTYTFPEEAKYADPDHCATMARRFMDQLIGHGTTTPVAYCSVHKSSADALFAEAAARNCRIIAGKVMMDRNAPAAVRDTPQSSYDDSTALIERWHAKGRAHYAITPRFALTSSPAQLEVAGALRTTHPDCYVQTHLSENEDEIRTTRKLYPDAPDYLGVYETYGLLGARSLFGHCLHLEPRERAAMAESGSVAVFCPTSNLFLGSGLFDEAGLAAEGVRCAIATDIGGGTNYSMLRTLDEGYKVLQLRNQNLNPLKSFYWVTLGNARALSLADRIGTLEPGSEADIVVIDAHATSAMTLRMETVRTLAEELFVVQTLGDDRCISAVYLAGQPAKHPSPAA